MKIQEDRFLHFLIVAADLLIKAYFRGNLGDTHHIIRIAWILTRKEK